MESLAANFLQSAKNYENWLTVDKFITTVTKKYEVFFDHIVLHILLLLLCGRPIDCIMHLARPSVRPPVCPLVRTGS